MKLTQRQQTFLRNLLDLWRQLDNRPIHYTELAEKVGVNRFTAYDMLKLLQEKGMVEARYRTTPNKSGPGRSEIVFVPTQLARQMFQEAAQYGGNWEEVKQIIFGRIQSGTGQDPELTAAILARVPEAGSSNSAIQFCVELLTVMVLRINPVVYEDHIAHFLSTKRSSDPAHLNLIAGFVLGVLAREQSEDPEWYHELITHVQQYQTIVMQLSRQECQDLADALDQVLLPLRQAQQAKEAAAVLVAHSFKE